MSMARNRKGISFTLTLVVVGVVLLMTALTVIVLGGGSVADFFQQSTEGSLDAAVSQACAQKAQQINNNYCDMYTNADSGGDGGDGGDGACDVRRNPSTEYDTLVENSENCNDWTANSGDRLDDILNEDGDDVTVTVQGNDYDCRAENEITATCPA